jgi:GNAT superfamily N-acetyltransferase
VNVSPITENSEWLASLWTLAYGEAEKKRGGPELLSTIRRDVSDDDILGHLIESKCLWGASNDDDVIVGFAIYRDRLVETLYVDRHFRRQGIARSLLSALRELPHPPLDAYALPGDRATKSIYESIGWKARLLTMRGE